MRLARLCLPLALLACGEDLEGSSPTDTRDELDSCGPAEDAALTDRGAVTLDAALLEDAALEDATPLEDAAPPQCALQDDPAVCDVTHELPIPTHYSAAEGGFSLGASDADSPFIPDPLGPPEAYTVGGCYPVYTHDRFPGPGDYPADVYARAVPDADARGWATAVCHGVRLPVIHLRGDSTPSSHACALQILHGRLADESIYTVVLPPNWDADAPLGTYPVVVSGFYDLNANTFQHYGGFIAELVAASGVEGRRGAIGVLWNGGGGLASRTMNPGALRDFGTVIGAVVEGFGAHRDWLILFGISRGGGTTLGVSSNPFGLDYRVVLGVALAAPTRIGQHAIWASPTYPGLLHGLGWSVGLADAWRADWRYPEGCGRPEMAGMDRIGAHVYALTGARTPEEADAERSLIAPPMLDGLEAAGTQIYLEVMGSDDIVPYGIQLEYAQALAARGLPVEQRILIRGGHDPLRLPGERSPSEQRVIDALARLVDPSFDLDGPPPAFVEPGRVDFWRVDRASRSFEPFTPEGGRLPFTVDLPYVAFNGERAPIVAVGAPGTRWRARFEADGMEAPVYIEGRIEATHDTQWLDLTEPAPEGVYSCGVEFMPPGEEAWREIPSTHTPTGDPCIITVAAPPPMDYAEIVGAVASPKLEGFHNTCWGLSEY